MVVFFIIFKLANTGWLTTVESQRAAYVINSIVKTRMPLCFVEYRATDRSDTFGEKPLIYVRRTAEMSDEYKRSVSEIER